MLINEPMASVPVSGNATPERTFKTFPLRQKLNSRDNDNSGLRKNLDYCVNQLEEALVGGSPPGDLKGFGQAAFAENAQCAESKRKQEQGTGNHRGRLGD